MVPPVIGDEIGEVGQERVQVRACSSSGEPLQRQVVEPGQGQMWPPSSIHDHERVAARDAIGTGNGTEDLCGGLLPNDLNTDYIPSALGC